MSADVDGSRTVASGAAVNTLHEGLRSFEQSATQMTTIFEKFDTRLGKLEREMLPMKDISENLTLARRNITKTIAKMDTINECFLLEKELHAVVHKGMRGNTRAVDYLEEMRRVKDAIVYFKEWPNLRSQKDALAGLENLAKVATKECLEEFDQLMRTVGQSVGFQAQTNTFEAAHTMSTKVAEGLGAVGQCLALLEKDDDLRQSYCNTRSVMVKSSLAAWEERFERNERGKEAKGSGAWLRFYIDFATKIVTAERVLWERSLKGIYAGGWKEEGHRDVEGGKGEREETHKETHKAKAEMSFVVVVGPVIDKLCREVDRAMSRCLQEMRERREALAGVSGTGGGEGSRAGAAGGNSSASAQKRHHRTRSNPSKEALSVQAKTKEGELYVDGLVALLEMSDAVHKGSYALQKILRVGAETVDWAGGPSVVSIPGVVTGGTGHRPLGSSSSQTNNRLRGTPRTRESPSAKTVSGGTSPPGPGPGPGDSRGAKNGTTNKNTGNRVTDALEKVQKNVSQSCLQAFNDLVEAVAKDPHQRRNVPENAAVHPLTPNVLKSVKSMMRFRKGYEALTRDAKMPWEFIGEAAEQASEGRPSSGGPFSASGAERGDAARACPKFTHFVNHLLRTLMTNLVEKASAYRVSTLTGAAQRDLFLINNVEYIMASSKVYVSNLNAVLNPADTPPSPTPEEKFQAIFGETPQVSSPVPGKDGDKGGRQRSHGKNKDVLIKAMKARGAAEGLVGPDAGDDVLGKLRIHDFLTDQTYNLLRRLVQEKQASYIQTLFDPLVKAAEDDVGELKYQRGSLLTLECGRLIKAKFGAFNSKWEEVYNSQRLVVVTDPSRRDKIKEEARQKAVGPYQDLYKKYADVQFSKKHQDQYVKFTPEDINKGINDLFTA